MTAAVDMRTWTLSIPAPGDWVPAVRTGKPMPPGGWPLKPAPLWLTLNKRLHWRAKDRIKKQWRRNTEQAAQAVRTHDGRTVRLPSGLVTRARIDAMLHFARAASCRDSINWHDTTKVVIDTLTAGTRTHPGWGFLPDDEPTRYLHCEDCPHLRICPQRLETKPPYGPVGLLVVTLTDLSQEVR